jgi:hypothetical protein
VSANQERPHVDVLPEDKANESIATGFELVCSTRQYKVMPIAGGWKKVLEIFLETYQSLMKRYPQKNFVMLLDFDNKFPTRLDEIKSGIPTDLIDRVFVIGVLSEPEKLKTSLNHLRLDKVGETLAEECRDNRSQLWEHKLLIHNQPEINRMPPIIKEILFSN